MGNAFFEPHFQPGRKAGPVGKAPVGSHHQIVVGFELGVGAGEIDVPGFVEASDEQGIGRFGQGQEKGVNIVIAVRAPGTHLQE